MSPFPARGDRIRWIEEREKRGTIAAHADAYEQTDSDFVVAMNDYAITHRNWLRNAIDFVSESERDGRPFCGGLFWAIGKTGSGGTLGTVFGHYYPYFPIARRTSYDAVGGYFSREFTAHFADPDLGLRFWAAGGVCRPCWDSVIVAAPERMAVTGEQMGITSALEQDMQVFLAKWRPVFGTDWPAERLHDFNIDIPAQFVAFDDMRRLRAMVRPPAQSGQMPRLDLSAGQDVTRTAPPAR